jgi:hypothetical protein
MYRYNTSIIAVRFGHIGSLARPLHHVKEIGGGVSQLAERCRGCAELLREPEEQVQIRHDQRAFERDGTPLGRGNADDPGDDQQRADRPGESLHLQVLIDVAGVGAKVRLEPAPFQRLQVVHANQRRVAQRVR